jgi:SpoVK/Ycf46/Vps4 family AAA+-type ATPase
MEELKDIRNWIVQQPEFSANKELNQEIKKGYSILFHGSAVKNKLATAEKLGKEFNKKVYRVDLSQLISKYIGETEKNLSAVFEKAEKKDWILFFDEADVLFGKRTNVRDSHDKYANQEVSYLLQRIEEYHGVVIIATNFKANIDSAFLRRFHTILHFSPPG